MDNVFSRALCDGQKDLISFLKKHPILITAAIIMFLSATTFCEQNYISAGNAFFILAGLIALFLVISITLSVHYGVRAWISCVIFIVLSVLAYVFIVNLREAPRRGAFIFIVGIAVLFVIALALAAFKKLTVERAIILLFLAGLLLRFLYVLYTSPSTRQHDVYNFKSDSGHAGYIKYLYENGHLPDFDVTTVDQFYHPPLHHVILAIWWKLLVNFGIADGYAQSAVQTLTLFYSCVCMILSYKIFRRLSIKGAGLIVAFTIVAFHPTFVIFSASINNDILSVTFILLSILCSLKWYKSRKLIDILAVAAAIGLGMSTKTSTYMVAFGIGFLFAYAFFKDKENRKKYYLQFGLFLALCVPLSLWWEIRNSVLYGSPFLYVPLLGSGGSWQYVGNVSAVERIFDFSKLFSSPVFDQWINRGDKLYNEYNPMISLLKTSLFGEYINDTSFPTITTPAKILFWNNNILVLLSVAAMLFAIGKLIYDKKMDELFVSIVAANVVMVVSYYIFCFSYPHHCSENIRYVSPVIVFGAAFIGKALGEVKSLKKPAKAKGSDVSDGARSAKFNVNGYVITLTVTATATAVFAVCSCLVFLLIGLK